MSPPGASSALLPERSPSDAGPRPHAHSRASRGQGPGARARPRPAGRRAEGVDPPTVRSAPIRPSASAARARASVGPARPAARRPGPSVPPLPVPGDRVDVFELEEAIGAGGMGAVFRAVDTKLDRQVALKILPPDQAVDPEVVQRYYQEGRAAARLDHENIARVYTIGDDGQYHYIAFEYIEGTTIRQRVEARRAAAGRRRDQLHAPDRQRPGPRRRAGGGPPRHQAVEHHRHPAGPGQARRHGPGPAVRAGRGHRPDPERDDPGDLRLHQPRAGPRPPRRRRPGRPVLAGLHPVPHALGPAAVPRGDGPPEAPPAPGGAAARHPQAQPGGARRPGGDPGQADGQGPRPPLPDARAARPRPADRGRLARPPLAQPRGAGLDGPGARRPAWARHAGLGRPRRWRSC